MSAAWTDALAAHATLSPELVTWARTQPDLETAWANCDRVAWLIELGTARATDDKTQRAVVIAAGALLVYEPWLLRLRPPGFVIAREWALHGDADRVDFFGTRRFDDYQNAVVVGLPIAIALMLVLQYGFHVAHSLLSLVRLLTLPAIYALARAWGIARRKLTARALRDYRFERAERDLIRPALQLARRVPPALQKGFIARFRRDWERVSGASA